MKKGDGCLCLFGLYLERTWKPLVYAGRNKNGEHTAYAHNGQISTWADDECVPFDESKIGETACKH